MLTSVNIKLASEVNTVYKPETWPSGISVNHADLCSGVVHRAAPGGLLSSRYVIPYFANMRDNAF